MIRIKIDLVSPPACSEGVGYQSAEDDAGALLH